MTEQLGNARTLIGCTSSNFIPGTLHTVHKRDATGALKIYPFFYFLNN